MVCQTKCSAHHLYYICVSKRKYHKSTGIPHSVRHNKCREQAWEKTIYQTPAKTHHKCRHDKHEIERPYMDKGVTNCSRNKTDVASEPEHKPALNKTAPENFLGRTYD